jgi:NADH:ubiquinone oxidoreductase subunit 6 (subunit J)
MPVAQILFGAIALISAGFAIEALLRRTPHACWYVMLTGCFALVFFLTVPDVRWEALAVSALVIIAGAVLMTTRKD